MKGRTFPKLSLLLLLLGAANLHSCGSTTTARSNRIGRFHEPRVEAIDAEHYALEIWLRPEERAIEGRCHLRFAVAWGTVGEIRLDLEGLEVRAVSDADGQSLEFSHDEGVLEIALARSLRAGDLGEVVVDYGGTPVKGLWFVDGPANRVRHVFTQGECVDAHWWFPCLDFPSDRATSELRVHMPKDWVSVAAGERIDQVEEGAERIEHWRMSTPHPTYLMTLCAGEFEVDRELWQGTPLIYMSDPRYAEWMDDSFSETGNILDYFGEVSGKPYPYSKYAQTCVGNFPFGGMENISATTLTETWLTDEAGHRDSSPVGLVAHEAAHQWFGDLLTCADWSEIWLNEGFATYMTNLYFEHTRGVDEFRIRMRNAQQSYTAADIGGKRRPTVHTFYKDPFDLFFDGKAYAGGASRLHLLRFELGDEAFFKGVQLYVSENVGRGVRTEDLQSAMETASGKDLSRFFEQWIFSAGYPELEVSWSWDEALAEVELRVDQIQSSERGTPSVFHLEVDVELRNALGRQTQRIKLDQRSQSWTFPSASRPIWLRFDKHSWLPARIRAKKTGSEWIAIAAEDDDVNGRRDAVDALGRLHSTEEDADKRAVYGAAILRRLRDDPIEAIRVEAVEAFSHLQSPEMRDFLMRAAKEDESADVREAALNQLANYGPDADLAAFAEEQFNAGYSWDVRIAAARLHIAAEPETAYPWLIDRADIPSPHAKLRSGLITLLAGLEHERVPADLKSLAARKDQTSATRQAAVAGLAERARSDREALDLLLQLMDSKDYRLRGSVIDALGKIRNGLVIARLRQELAASPYSPERRKLESTLDGLGASYR